MKEIRLFLYDCLLLLLFVLFTILFCVIMEIPFSFGGLFVIVSFAVADLYCIRKGFRGVSLLIDQKSDPLERDAVIGFATVDKLDCFPHVNFYELALEEMDGESIGGYVFFDDDDILEELHLDDIIHMVYYPRSRVILKMEKIGSLREGKKGSRQLRCRPIAEKGQSGDAGA